MFPAIAPLTPVLSMQGVLTLHYATVHETELAWLETIAFAFLMLALTDLRPQNLLFLQSLNFSCSLTIYTLEMALTAPTGLLLMRHESGYLPHSLVNFP